MSAVTILTNGTQARSGASDAFDATAFSSLRLDLRATADMGVSPRLALFIETAPTAAGPWRTIHESHRSSAASSWLTKERVTLGGYDAFVRLRWDGAREGEAPYKGPAQEAPALVDLKFVIGLTGDGKPDAA